MKFPNAYNGVKKIHTAAVLSLIGDLTFVIAAVLAVISGGMIRSGAAESAVGAMTGISAGLIVSSIAGGVLALIAFILNLVGTILASKDEAFFKTALLFIIVGIVATVLSMAFVNNSIVTDFSLIFVNLAQMLVASYIVQGIVNLASKLNEHSMVKQGGQVRIYLLIAYSVPIAVDLIAIILSLSKKSLLANVFSLAGSALSLVVYFIYLTYLKSAKKMLEAN